MWLDCRELGMGNEALHDFMIRKAKLGLNDGCSFGQMCIRDRSCTMT